MFHSQRQKQKEKQERIEDNLLKVDTANIL